VYNPRFDRDVQRDPWFQGREETQSNLGLRAQSLGTESRDGASGEGGRDPLTLKGADGAQ